jgi:hypothetical protein
MWKELLEHWEQLPSCHQNQMLQNQMPNCRLFLQPLFLQWL